MNKFFALTLAAFVCSALAAPQPGINDEASQFAFIADDKVETENLSAERRIFSDFCLQARDEVTAHIKANINKGASYLFKEVSEQILDSAAKINEREKVAIANGQKLVEEDARNTVQATGGVLNAFVDGIKSGFHEKFEAVKGLLTKDNVREQVFNGCDDILDNITPKLEAKLAETKNELSQSVSDEATKTLIQETDLSNVGCLVTSRFSKLARSCQKLKEISPETLKSLGL